MNGYHQLALFVVLFGGFLGWGLALDYREWLKTHVFGEVPFRPKFTGWLKSLLPPKNWDYWAKRFDPEYLLNLPMIQSVDFAMNTQQQFIRPKASQFPELDWGLLKAMEERRKLEKDWDEAVCINWPLRIPEDIIRKVLQRIANLPEIDSEYEPKLPQKIMTEFGIKPIPFLYVNYKLMRDTGNWDMLWVNLLKQGRMHTQWQSIRPVALRFDYIGDPEIPSTKDEDLSDFEVKA